LFKINCITSPLCVCNTENESVLHYLLKCPRYAALRHNLLSNAAQVYGDDFLLLSESRKVNILLRGSPQLNYSENQFISKHVQLYIKLTKRFS
jgi:CRISPR/Cas system-associated exonuclease Cas4 (RecB family)